MLKQEMYSTVLVHVSRTWERIRVAQPHEEMPIDNIESVGEIVNITDQILEDKVIVGFLSAKDQNDYFMEHTNEMSDTYIEILAEREIKSRYRIDWVTYMGKEMPYDDLVKDLRERVDADGEFSDEYIINEAHEMGEWDYLN